VTEQLEKAEVCDDPEGRRRYLSSVVAGVEVTSKANNLIRASLLPAWCSKSDSDMESVRAHS